MNNSDRVIEGTASYLKGQSFEDEIASLFIGHGYSVERRSRQIGREIDLICSREEFGFETVIMVECKNKTKPVGSSDIDKFGSRAKQMLVNLEITHAMMISASGFVDSGILNEVKTERVSFLKYSDFISKFVSFDYYIDRVVHDYENISKFKPAETKAVPIFAELQREDLYNRFYDLSARELGSSGKLFEKASESLYTQLLQGPEKLLLLGEIGSGKTSVCLKLVYQLAKNFRSTRDDFSSRRIPIYLSLSGARNYSDPFSFILDKCRSLFIQYKSTDELRRMLPCLPVVLILDGFDEIHPGNSDIAIEATTDFIAPFLKLPLPVLLTARTNYFPSLCNLNKTRTANFDDDVQLSAYVLEPITEELVKQQLQHLRPDSWGNDFDLINKTFNLPELSRRPILLKMIIDSLDELHKKRIIDKSSPIPVGPSELYATYTSKWIRKPISRATLPPEVRQVVVHACAEVLWPNSEDSVDLNDLMDNTRSMIKEKNVPYDDVAKLQYDITTCSFLVRHGENRYGFSHKSFMEFFVAELMIEEFKSGKYSIVTKKRIDRAVSLFMRDMIQPCHAQSLLALMDSKFSAARLTAHHLYRQLLRLNRFPTSIEFINKLRELLASEDDLNVKVQIVTTLAHSGHYEELDGYLSDLLHNSVNELEKVVNVAIITYYETTDIVDEALFSRIDKMEYEYARLWFIFALGFMGTEKAHDYLGALTLLNERPLENEAIKFSMNLIRQRI